MLYSHSITALLTLLPLTLITLGAFFALFIISAIFKVLYGEPSLIERVLNLREAPNTYEFDDLEEELLENPPRIDHELLERSLFEKEYFNQLTPIQRFFYLLPLQFRRKQMGGWFIFLAVPNLNNYDGQWFISWRSRVYEKVRTVYGIESGGFTNTIRKTHLYGLPYR